MVHGLAIHWRICQVLRVYIAGRLECFGQSHGRINVQDILAVIACLAQIVLRPVKHLMTVAASRLCRMQQSTAAVLHCGGRRIGTRWIFYDSSF